MLKSIALGLFINPAYCEAPNSIESPGIVSRSITTTPVHQPAMMEKNWKHQLDALVSLASESTQGQLKTTPKKARLFQQIVEETEFDIAEVLKVYRVRSIQEIASPQLRSKVERELAAVTEQAVQSALKFLSQEQQERLLNFESAAPEIAYLQSALRF